MQKATANTYLSAQQNLLPSGEAWSRESSSTLSRLLSGLALLWAKVHNRSLTSLDEADPRTTLELLPDWEAALGLPDDCLPAGSSIQERRDAVLAKLDDDGRQDPDFYRALAATLGYAVTIQEYSPFVCGLSCCGDVLNGGHDVRYYWQITVHGPRVTLFRCGASAPPDYLGKTSHATELECLIRRYKLAHTYVIFNYEYV